MFAGVSASASYWRNARVEQEGNVFVVPVKDWETYAVEITVGEVLCEYEYEPQQMGLW